MWYPLVVAVLTGYLLGNLNGSVSISTLVSHEDVRSHGSGNAGFTNFVRSFGLGNAALVLLIDVMKTVMACAVGGLLLKPYGHSLNGMMLGAIAVTLGHDFPALLGFRGGKGILCGISAAFVIDWRAAAIILGVFLLTYLLLGYVSLASVMGAVTYGVTFWAFHGDDPYLMWGGIFIGLLAVFMHRGNLARLCKGTEPKTPLIKKVKKQ